MTIDIDYFNKKLNLVIRDLRQYSAEELSTELQRLANTAKPANIIALEQEESIEPVAYDKNKIRADVIAKAPKDFGICTAIDLTMEMMEKSLQASRELTIKEYEAKQSSGGEPVGYVTEKTAMKLYNSIGEELIFKHKEQYKNLTPLYLAQPDQSARIVELEGRHKRDIGEYQASLQAISKLTADNEKLREAVIATQNIVFEGIGYDKTLEDILIEALAVKDK